MIFKPSFDCIININNKTLDPKQGETTIEADENANILVYPLATSKDKHQLLPYAFRVENLLKSGEAPNHINIEIFDNVAEIVLKPYPLFSVKCGYLLNEEKVSLQGKPYTIKINSSGEDNILVYQDSSLLLRYTVPSPTEALISQIDKFVIISGKTTKPFALVINLALMEVILLKECDKIEIDHNLKKILCLTDLKTSLRHGYVEIYKLAETVELESEYPTFIERIEKSGINAVRVFNFFDSVKAKDFITSKSLLAPNLAHLTSEMLNEYFKNYKNIKQSDCDNEFYLIPNGSVCIAEKFIFEFDAGLISNIKPI